MSDLQPMASTSRPSLGSGSYDMKIATGTLVMALDGSKMQLFRNNGDTRKPVLQLLASQQNENPRSSSQGSDRPGRSFSSASPRRSAMSETDLHDQAEREFTRSASKILEEHQAQEGGDVILLAAPSCSASFASVVQQD